MLRRVVGPLVAASSLAVAAPAHATLEEDATRLFDAWRAAGMTVERRPPMFLEAGHLTRVPVTADEASIAGEGCTSIVAIGPRGVDFVLRSHPVPHALVLGPPKPERSLAGVGTLTRCGDEREELAMATIELRSARAAIEVVVARTPQPPPAVSDTLVERFVPRQRPPVDPGRAPSQENVGKRSAAAEARARADGASAVVLQLVQANDDGAGRAFVSLREGCHRLELLAELGAHGRVADLDAELRDGGTNMLLARDRSDTPDARLEVCVGEPIAALLVFAGAPLGGRVAVLDAQWPLPSGVPTTWGPRARGTMSMGLLRRRAPAPTKAPFSETLGASGATLVPVALTPGRCYVATAASVRGESRVLLLTANVENRISRDDGGAARDGATITFCSRRSESTTIRVDARGAGLAWVLGVWDVGEAPSEEPAP